MSRTTAAERMRRVLALVPWIAAQPEGASIEEACRRFGVTRAALLADLDVIFMVGLYPFSPDTLIDVEIDDDTVKLRYADVFSRPLRLGPDEGLALVAAGSALLATPGAEADGPLARALAKLAGVLGIDAASTVEVALGTAEEKVLEVVRAAVEDHRSIEIDYYSGSRDDRATRVVDPWALWAAAGHWYMSGHCHLAGGERVFRLDRVAEARALDEHFEAPRHVVGAGGPSLARAEELPTVTIEVQAGDRWVADSLPVRSVEAAPDGRLRVTLPVAARAWLERLLLRLGPSAVVLDGTEGVADGDVRAEAARRVLARYR